MLPSRHIVISFSLGAVVWFFTKSVYAALVCLCSGVFLDADHIIEHAVNYGWRECTYKKCVLASQQTVTLQGDYRYNKLHLIFHSIEIAFLLWAFVVYTGNVYFLAAAIGYSAHLLLDQLGNKYIRPPFYFIIWRAAKQFQVNNLCKRSIQNRDIL